MKRAGLILVVIILVIIGAYFLGRAYIVPEIIAKSVASDNPPPKFLPEKIQETVVVIKDNVNENVDELPKIMNDLDLTFDDILFMVDHVNADEVMTSLDELNQSSWSTTDEAYDIIVKNVKIEGYDLEIFRPVFNQKAKAKQIRYFLGAIEKNNLRTSMSVPVARNTAKRILMDNREKIESQLDHVNGK